MSSRRSAGSGWRTNAAWRSLPHGLWAPPVRELPLTAAVRSRARALAASHPGLGEVLEQLAEGIAVEGMEALAPVLADGMQLLVDVVPTDAAVIVVDPERVRRRSHDLLETSSEFLAASWANAAAGNTTPIDLAEASYRPWADVREAARRPGASWWGVGPFGLGAA